MIATMHKVQLAAPKRQAKKFMIWLQEQAILHVTATSREEQGSTSNNGFTQEMAHIQFALEFIDRVKDELNIKPAKSWRDLFASKPAASLGRLEQTINNLSLKSIHGQIRQASDKLAQFKVRQQDTADLLNILRPWHDLDATGQQLHSLSTSRHVLLQVGPQDEALVKKTLTDIKTAVWREISRRVNKKQGKFYLAVIVHHSQTDQLDQIIDTSSATIVNLPLPTNQTVASYINNLQAEQKSNSQRYQSWLEKSQRFLPLEPRLQLAYDAILHRQERSQVSQKSLHLPNSLVITGWVPQHRYHYFTHALARAFPAAAVVIDQDSSATPPVALKNAKFIEPFEAVTNIYGRPKYYELDPTGPLSLFFLIAFGLALTDAGYGLTIMLATWLATKYFRLKTAMRKMLKLLFYAGASTTIFGALTGGWFGITISNLPDSAIKSGLLSLKVIDPVTNPMTLLLVSFAVGIIQLLFAWLVRAWDHARQQQYVAMLFDDITWFVMVVLLLLWASSSYNLFLTNYTQPLLTAFIIAVALAVFGGGRSYKNPVLMLGAGVLSLYNLVSFLSDTLSYSRLLALGLATSIIALVVNMIGGMISVAIPGIGWLLAAIVLVVGHLFNLGINTLGAFIHSGRLQYVEFFPKFLEGGGKPYLPFGRVSKYVDNPNEFN